MEFKFDLQLFAEEIENTEVVEKEPEATVTKDGDHNETFNTPEELAGIPEDIAKEIVAEYEKTNAQEDSTEESQSAEPDNDVSAGSDSDNNADTEFMPKTNIPYARFKKQIDKTHELESKNSDLEKQLSELKQKLEQKPQTLNPKPPESKAVNPPVKPKAPVINSNVAEQIRQAVESEAMKLSGLTEDEVSEIEYLDDDDERKKTWDTACQFARDSVMRQIQQARQQQMEYTRRLEEQRAMAVTDYNSFAEKEFKDPNYSNIVNYAQNEYFEKTSPGEQQVIAIAYANIEKNMATPQDITLIKRYYSDAKRSYLAKMGKAKNKTTNNNVIDKVKQGKAFPRSTDIDGAGSDAGGVTIESLEKMLNSTPFEQIPKQYQDMLLGYK